MEDITERIYFYGKLKDYNWSKRSIRETIFANLDYSLIITGYEKKSYPKDIPSIEVDRLRKLLNKSIEFIILQLKKKRLSKTDKKFSMELTNEILSNKEELVPAFPSNSFVIQFISKIVKGNITVCIKILRIMREGFAL